MLRILGIDPGSRVTGYGVIQVEGSRHIHISSGVIRIKPGDMTHRLQQIYHGVKEVIAQFRPDEAAIEKVFMHLNPNGALTLGQARGAAIVSIAEFDLTMAEYSARQIKQSVVGYGNADKAQVQHMIKVLLNLPQAPVSDAADALATALCHAGSRTILNRVGGKGTRQGRLQ